MATVRKTEQIKRIIQNGVINITIQNKSLFGIMIFFKTLV